MAIARMEGTGSLIFLEECRHAAHHRESRPHANRR